MENLSESDVIIAYLSIFTCYLGYNWLQNNQAIKRRRYRRFYSRAENLDHNIHGFYETTFKAIKLNEEEFFKHTRMTVPVYEILLSLVKEKLTKKSTCNTICAEERLALTLCHLSQGVSPQFLGWSYKIGRSTARKIVLDTCEVIWNVLSPLYANKPNSEDYKLIAEDFKNIWDLPNCVGAIDGKHIAIQCPDHSGSQFYNYKNFFSLVLLAASDAKYIFTMVDVGAYGSQSDGGILTVSEFGKELLLNKLPLPEEKNLPHSNLKFPHYFVGDPAFPLKINLMRAYPGKCLTLDKKIYNYRISRARVVIENAFGILVARWRVLRSTLNYAPKNAEKVVLAALALHNFIKLNKLSSHLYCPPSFVDSEDSLGNIIHGRWREELKLCASAMQKNKLKIGSNNAAKHAFLLRNELKNYFLNEGVIARQHKIK